MSKFQVGDLVTTNRDYDVNVDSGEIGSLLTVTTVTLIDGVIFPIVTDVPSSDVEDDYWVFDEDELELVVWP